MYYLTKRFRFEAAHRLAKGYKGKCANIHGHSWNGEIKIACTKLDAQDMGVDFKEIGLFLESIEDLFDHAILLHESDTDLIQLCEDNKWSVVEFKENPTCETLARYIFNKANNEWKKFSLFRVESVTIEETCTTSCTYFLNYSL
jgi:6-pyruvoyltetrahydropterin/6-carboxytetrahydropterin synthase